MNILVTGGLGFIGSNLVDKLIELGYTVTVLDNLSTGKKENLNPKARFILGDVQIFKTNERFDVIYHVAALARIQPSIENPVEFHDTNLNGTLNTLMLAKQCGAKFVFSSSSSVYGETDIFPTTENVPIHPGSPYAAQKYMSEVYCRLFSELYGLNVTVFRYFNVYGFHQILTGAYAAVVGIFLDQFKNNKSFTIVGDGTQSRDFINVQDVVSANVLAVNLKGFNIFNVGVGYDCSINDLADMISITHPRIYLPRRSGEYQKTLAGNSKLIKLGWQPTITLKQWIESIK